MWFFLKENAVAISIMAAILFWGHYHNFLHDQPPMTGLILGFRPANERHRYKVTPFHWLGANLESALNKAMKNIS